jgi:mono/diheme cytochrome c family protein
MMVHVKGGGAPLVGLVIAVAIAGSTAAAGDDPGRALYQRYCGACHGREGRGDGPVAGSLGEHPADLTTIAREHGGQFPAIEVMAIIDGTTAVRSHGVSEMPVWGEVFRPQPGWSLAEHATAKGRLLLITEYLETIQRK